MGSLIMRINNHCFLFPQGVVDWEGVKFSKLFKSGGVFGKLSPQLCSSLWIILGWALFSLGVRFWRIACELHNLQCMGLFGSLFICIRVNTTIHFPHAIFKSWVKEILFCLAFILHENWLKCLIVSKILFPLPLHIGVL